MTCRLQIRMASQKTKRLSAGPVLGVSVCVVRDGRVLLTQRAEPPFKGRWSLPGGHVEWGERLKDAALRELKEETRLDARLRHIIDWAEIIDEARHFVIAVFLADWVRGEAIAGGDAKDARWADLEELKKLDLTPGLADMLSRALSR
jgi:ADP-ribose pyrophosphatase YjhB (NUDIX family)